MPAARKKLIEVALPLEDINREAAREKSIRHGHPSTLHLWWVRRPLAAARAVIFAQMVDDPSSLEEFPTEEAQEAERQRLFQRIRELVKWENTTNEHVLAAARAEIRKSWARWCRLSGEDPTQLPPFHDPFAGGGSLPLEAQRLGLEAHASDLNPVAVLINKAMIEIPPRFAGQPPVNPEARGKLDLKGSWRGAAGLADDVRYYGAWMRQQAWQRIGHLYPKATLLDGRQATVIAWLWARTVESPNPAFRGCQVPLVPSFWLSTKPGQEAWVGPVVEGKSYRFEVRTGKPVDKAAVDAGTKLGRGANFRCLLSSAPIAPDYIRKEAQAGRMGSRLMAIVAEGDRGRIYLTPTEDHAAIAKKAVPKWKPDQLVTTPCLEAVIRAGFSLTGTWPTRTERASRSTGIDTNALASSIVLVCRPRPTEAPVTTRRDFLTALKREMPSALHHLQEGNIAPVDLAQASIGPGMAIFTRYARILESDGTPMRVRTALALINQTLDEMLAEQEGDFDTDTGWAVAWFDQFGFNDGPFGEAETLCKAKNTAIGGLQAAGIAIARAGKGRLLRVDELPADWVR